MKSLSDFAAVLIFLTFSVLTVLLVSFIWVVCNNASRCTLMLLLFLMVYRIWKSGLETHLVIFCLNICCLFLHWLLWASQAACFSWQRLGGLSGWSEKVGCGMGNTFHATSHQLKCAQCGEFLHHKQNSFVINLLKTAK